jgi:hypothetical protein
MSARSSNISRRSSRSVSEETVKITLARLRAEEERAKAEREKILADQAELAKQLKEQEERSKAEREKILTELNVMSSGGSSRRSSICLTSANDSFKSSFSMQRYLDDQNTAEPTLPTPFLQVDGNATLETVVDGGAHKTPINPNKETLFQHPESGLRRDPTQFNTSDETDHWSFMPEKQTKNDTDQNFDFELGGGTQTGVDDASTPLRPKTVLQPPKFQRDQIVTTDQAKMPDFGQIKIPKGIEIQSGNLRDAKVSQKSSPQNEIT